MLKLFIFNLLKPYLNIIFYIASAGTLVLIYSQLYLYAKNKKKKIPVSIIALSGLTIFIGTGNMLLIPILKESPDSLSYLFLVKVMMFFLGIFEIYLGILFLQAKNWARILFFWFLALVAISDIIITMTSNNFNHVFSDIGLYAVVFTAYYFGLDKKYFKKEGEDFTLQDDAAIKKKHESFFDWLKE